MDVKEKRDMRKKHVRKLTFIRNDNLRKKLDKKWRKQKAFHHNKARVRDLVKIRNVKEGYKAPKVVRGIHPSGYEEVLVSNVKDLERVNPKLQAIKIRKIGKKKKKEILSHAEKMKIKVLNPGV